MNQRTIKFAFFFLFFVFLAESCKKCTSCEVKDSNQNIIQESTKTCGNSTEVDKAKTNARDLSKLIGGSYTCTDE